MLTRNCMNALLLIVALVLSTEAHAQAGWLNVKSYGAVGNGSSDDTAAINSALAALPARGGIVYFPPGRYRASTKIALPDKRVSLLGDGIGISTIEWTNVDGGLLYQPSIAGSSSGADNGRELSLEKLTLRTTQLGGGAALKATWPEVSGQVVNTLRISDVEVRGSDFTKTWSNGLQLTGARNSSINNLVIFGSSTSRRALGFGVQIHSNTSSTEYFLSRIKVLFAGTGLLVSGGAAGAGKGPEGVYVEQSAFIDVGIGVNTNTGSSEPLLFVRGSHIAATGIGINSSALQSVFSDNVIYHSTSGGVGIKIFGAVVDVAIRNNHFMSTRVPETSTGVVVVSPASRVTVTGNSFNTITSGVWLQSGSSNSYVADNVFVNCANKVVNQGTANTVLGWGSAAP